MKYHLLTYEQSQDIVKSNPEMCFFETKHVVDGYNISIFLYKLSWYDNFKCPLPHDLSIEANEMRGTCYVFNEDGTLFKRYLMLDKFWNLNQVSETLYQNVKDLKISSIQAKEDGSLIRFIKLPNGKIIPKTKGSLSAPEQLDLVNEIMLNNKELMRLVEMSLNNDIALFFELTSFKNKIVLDYKTTDLILLKARDENTGEYIDIENFKEYAVTVPVKYNYTLDEMIELSTTLEGIEGWVIQFENGFLVKLKTDWYRRMHRLLTESLNRENDIIILILNETIDDVISEVPEDQVEKRLFVEDIIKKVNQYMSETYHDINTFMQDKFINECNSNVKEFAIKYAKTERFNFSAIMSVVNGQGDIYDYLKKHLLSKTLRLENAREFINNITI